MMGNIPLSFMVNDMKWRDNFTNIRSMNTERSENGVIISQIYNARIWYVYVICDG